MNDCFVVLEPLNHMYKVIEGAAARGYDVVAFHSSPLSATGRYRKGLEAIGERHQVEIQSWDDPAGVLQTILKVLNGRRVVGTYAGVEAVLHAEAALREHVGLPTHGVAALANLLNKRWVRMRLRAAGLSRLADFDPRALVSEDRWPLPGKCGYLKPITGGGSLHVTRCRRLGDVAAGLREWDDQALACRPIMRQHLDRGGGLFLEEEADGELMSLEGWIYDGKYHALGLTSRTLLARDPAVEMGATFPYEHPLRAQIESKIAAIHEALDMRHGATHAELIVGADGSVELVELNVRFGGSDILLLMELTLPTPADGLLVDLACGVEPRQQEGSSTGYASMQQLLAPAGTRVLESVELDQECVIEGRPLKELGKELLSTNYQSDHVATYIVRGRTYQEALERAGRVRLEARVNGSVLGEDRNNVVVLR